MTRLAVQLLISALVIIAAGTAMARAADVIAARTKLGRLWVGSVFLAIATSLPEIFTDLSAVRLRAPDIAVGDLFGSNMANMVILALVSLAPAGKELFRKAALDHALYAALAITLTAGAAVGVIVQSPTTFGPVGITSIILLGTYLVGSRVIYRHSTVARIASATVEMSEATDIDGAAAGTAPRSITRSALILAAGALLLMAAAPQFASGAAGLARLTGLGETFISTWLVGISTSLPELVTALAAIRLGAYDLAVGNLFGSNAFNMAVFPLLDLAHPEGSVLAAAHPAHALSALMAVALMGIGLAALVSRSRGRFTLLEPSSAAILVTYIAGLVLVLTNSAP